MTKLSCFTRATQPKCLCASPYAKLIGTLDGMFPDFGHHSEAEMCGLWMHPIKILDGFWLRFKDFESDNVDRWVLADEYTCLPTGNRFEHNCGLGHTRVTITRDQIAPEEAAGIVLTYRIVNHDEKPRKIEAEWLARTELYPVWYSLDCKAFEDGRDHGAWDEAAQTFRAKDEKNPWFAALRSAVKPDSVQTGDALFGPQRTQGQGTSVALTFGMTLAAHEERTLTFYLTGSAESAEEAEQRLEALAAVKDPEAAKAAHTDRVLAASALCTGDKDFDNVWAWAKLNADWLDVDAGRYGRAMSAGMPEYPWWFGCDSCYAIQGLLAIGMYDLARSTLKLIADYSEKTNGNGRIVHEITTYGICSNPGNTQETAHFVTALWHYWRWTGDRTLIDETMPLVRKCMAWLTAQDTDGDTFPDGYGIIEIQGLNAEMIDSIAYTVQAWGCYADLCALVGDREEAERAKETHARAWKAMDERMWDEELGTYCDAYASPDFVRSRRKDILGRYTEHNAAAEKAFDEMLARKTGNPKEEVGFYINGNWTIATPMETGAAPRIKADRALAFMDTPDFIGRWGVYLNALNKDAIMTISTGVFATAQARYGYADRALALLEKMTATFGLYTPGSMCEMSPDYGCFAQAWTAYALFTPVVRHLFGIAPDAAENCVNLMPQMPAKWAKAEIKDVRVLGGTLSVGREKTRGGYTLTLSGKHCAEVRVKLQAGESAEGMRDGVVRVNVPENGEVHITVTQQAK